MIKACIFDLDGTLLDTLDDLSDSVNAALKGNGFPVRTRDEVRARVGNGVAALISRSLPEDTSPQHTQQVLADFLRHYTDNQANHTLPYPGIMDLLETLRLSGISLGILSNKVDAAVQTLAAHHFGDTFQVALGDRPDIARKPDPAGLLQLLKELDVTPEEALYLGDSEVDVATCRAAGVFCVAVLWGFRDRKALEAAGADCCISVPEEVLPLLFEGQEAEEAVKT